MVWVSSAAPVKSMRTASTSDKSEVRMAWVSTAAPATEHADCLCSSPFSVKSPSGLSHVSSRSSILFVVAILLYRQFGLVSLSSSSLPAARFSVFICQPLFTRQYQSEVGFGLSLLLRLCLVLSFVRSLVLSVLQCLIPAFFSRSYPSSESVYRLPRYVRHDTSFIPTI
jgi:hypothetical protein